VRALALLLLLPALAQADDELVKLRAENARLRERVAQLEAREAKRGPRKLEVVRVVDGDTIVVRYAPLEPQQEYIRMLRIDTPERGEKDYRVATVALSRMIKGKRVSLAFEKPGKPARDRYGRLLAYVILPDGRNACVELVRSGMTTFWTKYGAGRFAEQFRAAEREAKRSRRGLWSSGGMR
jgi:endonuclease YncB( thermonuclease family)